MVRGGVGGTWEDPGGEEAESRGKLRLARPSIGDSKARQGRAR